MVAGQVGAHGRLVLNPVELVFRNVRGVARNQLQNMAGNLAMEIPEKVVDATRIPAPVRKNTNAVFFFFFFICNDIDHIFHFVCQ